MGLVFACCQYNKDPIEIWCRLPDSSAQRRELFNLWREKKSELIEDGFSVKKLAGEYVVIYKSPRTPENLEIITIGNLSRIYVELEFVMKCCTWESIMTP